MRKFLFLIGSSRTAGNTETLAKLAAEYLPAGAEQRWLRLDDYPLEQFQDRRHTAGRIPPPPQGNEKILFDATLEATDIVVLSPLYWYSVSTSVKRYLDHWSGWMYLADTPFKALMAGKTFWGVSVAEERDQEEHLVGTLQRSANYLRMRWGGVLVGHGNRPDDVLNDAPALVAAKSFFQDI
jgi:multimeric flavodoxin WrbA